MPAHRYVAPFNVTGKEPYFPKDSTPIIYFDKPFRREGKRGPLVVGVDSAAPLEVRETLITEAERLAA
jgi:hypothetical protein